MYSSAIGKKYSRRREISSAMAPSTRSDAPIARTLRNPVRGKEGKGMLLIINPDSTTIR